MKKSCIIYVVAAVALQARLMSECKELLPGRAVRLAPVRAWQVLFCYKEGYVDIGGWLNWGSFTNLSCKK